MLTKVFPCLARARVSQHQQESPSERGVTHCRLHWCDQPGESLHHDASFLYAETDSREVLA
jgi:hypothetical protein